MLSITGMAHAALEIARQLRAVAVHPADADVGPGYIEAAHAGGFEVNVWTVDDEDRIRQLAGWGVDGVITNEPSTALAVLGG